MLRRDAYKTAVEHALARSPICALLGPRQCGKTTPFMFLRVSGGTASTFAPLKRRLVEHRRVELIVDCQLFMESSCYLVVKKIGLN